MILTNVELFPKPLLPSVEDRDAAARVTSLFCLMASAWFFVTPWAFFGVSDQSSGWNAWIVGGLMVLASMVRLIHPQGTTAFSAANVVFSIWALISPFVFGYVSDTSRLVNSLSVGAVALSFAFLSLRVTNDVEGRIGTTDTYPEGAVSTSLWPDSEVVDHSRDALDS